MKSGINAKQQMNTILAIELILVVFNIKYK